VSVRSRRRRRAGPREPLESHLAERAGAAAALLAAAAFAASCSVTPPRAPEGRDLVDPDAPVFDKRFRDLEPGDLELSRFWIEAASHDPEEAIPLDHRTVARLVRAVADGTVNIYTTVLQEQRAEIGVSPNDVIPFRIPLVSAVLDVVPFKVPIPFRSEGFSLGSGFLINREGYLLTNEHVVRNATDVRVVRSGTHEELQARIIGMDRLTDTALLKIEPQPGMTVLTLGDSDGLEVGEMVVAVGNPLGLQHTVTSGLVSAKERIVPGAENTLVDFLQTDSAINPGSSGGPLLNLRGEVVGVNTAIVSNAQSIGFAIPINTVKQVMALLIVGKTERGWFGVSARPFEPGEARAAGYPNPSAVVIEDVADDSPAGAAGIRPADVIVAVDGQRVEDFVAFRRQMLGRLPGQKLRLLVSRDGEIIEFESVLVAKPGA